MEEDVRSETDCQTGQASRALLDSSYRMACSYGQGHIFISARPSWILRIFITGFKSLQKIPEHSQSRHQKSKWCGDMLGEDNNKGLAGRLES